MSFELEIYNISELRDMAKKMSLPCRRSKTDMIKDISKAFQEYLNYKHNKIDKYEKIRKIGTKGKEGITYLVKNREGLEFAMKTFRKSKSSDKLLNEYNLQKRASLFGICPSVIEHDTVSKYIVMEKMEYHLLDLMKKQNGNLNRTQQFRIIEIFKKLDEAKIFHGDANLRNYMIKNNKIYIIDFGFAKIIDRKLCKKYANNQLNMTIMILGFVLKLKEYKCPSSSWKYLKKYISTKSRKKFNIN